MHSHPILSCWVHLLGVSCVSFLIVCSFTHSFQFGSEVQKEKLGTCFLIGNWGIFFSFFLFFFSSTSLFLPTHLPPPLCTHAQSYNPRDFNPPDSSVHGFFQARILEWVAISFSNWGILRAYLSGSFLELLQLKPRESPLFPPLSLPST